jgi:lysophospholipase L1-like esterase
LDATANAAYGKMHIGYSTATVSQYADGMKAVARELALPCVDLFALFGVPPDGSYFGPDGLHPNLAGQMQMLRAVLKVLG